MEFYEELREFTRAETESLAKVLEEYPHSALPCPSTHEECSPPLLQQLRQQSTQLLLTEAVSASLFTLLSVRDWLDVMEQCRLQSVHRAWHVRRATEHRFLREVRNYFIFDVPLFSVRFARNSLQRGRAVPLHASSAFYLQ